VLESATIIDLADSGIEDITKPLRELAISQSMEVTVAWKIGKEQVQRNKIGAFNLREDEMRHVSQS
jgi:hypothetical protein